MKIVNNILWGGYIPFKEKNMKKILIDIGSSTTKIYTYDGEKLSLFKQVSIVMKDGFDSSKGISSVNEEKLLETVESLKNQFPDYEHKLYATGIFRKLEKKSQTKLIDTIFLKTGTYLNIINHELESFYLEKALSGKYHTKEPFLLINIGGATTELVIIENGNVLEKINIELGVGTINTQFSDINKDLMGHSMEEIIAFIKEKLPTVEKLSKVAFYSGGELSFMKLAGYPLFKNTLFDDSDHPLVISFSDFKQETKKICFERTLDSLKNLMLENPSWMNGARGCSLIAQTICEEYGISTMVPSDSNLIDGVVRQEFRSVVLSGSFRKHLEYILSIKKMLNEKGFEVLSPRFNEPKNPGEEFVVFEGEEGESPLDSERHRLESIVNADALIVCSKEGYVGASALIEIGFAQANNIPVIFTEKPTEFMLGVLPSQISL